MCPVQNESTEKLFARKNILLNVFHANFVQNVLNRAFFIIPASNRNIMKGKHVPNFHLLCINRQIVKRRFKRMILFYFHKKEFICKDNDFRISLKENLVNSFNLPLTKKLRVNPVAISQYSRRSLTGKMAGLLEKIS